MIDPATVLIIGRLMFPVVHWVYECVTATEEDPNINGRDKKHEHVFNSVMDKIEALNPKQGAGTHRDYLDNVSAEQIAYIKECISCQVNRHIEVTVNNIYNKGQ